MVTYSETMEIFLDKHTGNISRSLAEKVITQYGGEEEFILNRDKYMDGEVWAVWTWSGLNVRCNFFTTNKTEILKTVSKEREECGELWLTRFRDAAMVDTGISGELEAIIDNDSLEEDSNLVQGMSLYIAALLARRYYYYSLEFRLDLPEFSPMPKSWNAY